VSNAKKKTEAEYQITIIKYKQISRKIAKSTSSKAKKYATVFFFGLHFCELFVFGTLKRVPYQYYPLKTKKRKKTQTRNEPLPTNRKTHPPHHPLINIPENTE